MEIPNTPIKNGIEFSFTLNPNDKHQFFGRVARTGVATISHRTNIAEHIRPYIQKLQLFPEYSFPLKSGKTTHGPRLHYHGTIVFKNIIGFLESGYYQLTKWCNIDFDSIEDPSYWKSYCIKDQNVMKDFYKERHIKYGISGDYQPLAN